MTDIAAVLDEVGSFRDKFGAAVERVENAWLVHTMRKNHRFAFDFNFLETRDRDLAIGFVRYLRHQLQVNGVEHSRNTYLKNKLFLDWASYSDADGFLEAFQSHKRELRQRSLEPTLYYTKDWFLWCANQSLDGFDDAETYWTLKDTVIPGNAKGRAVETSDPEDGPLFEVEENALRAALQECTLTLRAKALVWIFFALGPNPMNVALLAENDVAWEERAGVDYYSLKVPRIKKRLKPRAQFMERKLDKFLGSLLIQLRDENIRRYGQPAQLRPLFWGTEKRDTGADWRMFEWFSGANDLSRELSAAIDSLRVVSPITGEVLRITPRRLRYSFATRQVLQGCDSDWLARLLDHSDEQNVMVYFKNKEAHKTVNASINERFGRVAKRFLGRIMKDERSAGGTAQNRIKEIIDLNEIMNLGSCGLDGPCNKAMPAGCYECRKFVAWEDAPHERFLEQVKKRANGPREAVQMSGVISAIQQVVDACKK
jgi:integrase